MIFMKFHDFSEISDFPEIGSQKAQYSTGFISKWAHRRESAIPVTKIFPRVKIFPKT